MFCVYMTGTFWIYINDASAQASGFPGYPPAPLHQTDNYDAAMVGEPLCSIRLLAPPNSTRDEYPFKTSKEGGKNYQGRKAQVSCAPVGEQSSQGGQLNAFYSRELLQQDDAAFFVMPVPW